MGRLLTASRYLRSLFVAAGFGNRGIVIETGFEGVAGHLIEGGSSALRAPLRIGEDITQRNAAVPADEVIRHFARVEELDQKGARHAKKSCRPLRGELLLFGQKHQRPALLQFADYIPQQIAELCRQHGVFACRTDERGRATAQQLAHAVKLGDVLGLNGDGVLDHSATST